MIHKLSYRLAPDPMTFSDTDDHSLKRFLVQLCSSCQAVLLKWTTVLPSRRYASTIYVLWLCVRLSVCPWVTSRHCIETAERIELILA